MKTSIEEAWQAASERMHVSPPKPGDYLIFLVDENSEKKIYGGADSDGNPLLAVEVHTKPPVIKMNSAALDYFRHERKKSSAWLMVLRLQRRDLTPVFGRLCQDLIDEISGVGDEAAVVELVRRRLTLWQRLFEDGREGVLADFQIKGLIAELLLMQSILKEGRRDALEVAAAWVGPAGGDQDFRFSDEAIEVKAVGPDADGVSISSLQQLDSPLSLRLSVWTLRHASPGEAKATTLNALVTKLEQCFVPHPSALAMFREALLEVGYVESSYYEGLAFEPIQVESFVVDEFFPRLMASTVPVGVRSATYVVSLQSIRTRH